MNRTIKRIRKCPLTLETLEDRCLMAGGLTATLAKGVLTINGTNAADTIQVKEVNQRISIDGTQIRVAGTNVADLKTSQVSRIVINGKGGDDTINLSQSAGNSLTRPATIFGGAGNDQIWGGAAADKIYGDAGNDMLYGMDGMDQLFGQAGNDQLDGGAGNDRLDGGPGLDLITASAGQDKVLSTEDDSKGQISAMVAPKANLADTQLSQAIDAFATTLRLGGTDTGAGNVPFLIQIDGEIMRVVQVVDQATWIVERGVANTRAQPHAAGASIDTNIQVGGGGGNTGGQTSAPPAPTPLSWSPASGTDITLSWKNVAGETGYVVEYWNATSKIWVKLTTVGADVTTQYVQRGSGFYFRVGAFNAVGTTYTEFILAGSGTGGSTGGSGGTRAPVAPKLSWTAATGTDIKLSWNNIANETGYIIEYWNATSKIWVKLTTVGADVLTQYVQRGSGLYFRVGAFNAAGTAFSDFIQAGTGGGSTGGQTSAPPAPTQIKATLATGTDITLTWNNVPGETGYIIEYWNATSRIWVKLNTVAAEVTSQYVQRGSGFYFRVGAFNVAGTNYSGYIQA